MAAGSGSFQLSASVSLVLDMGVVMPWTDSQVDCG
jgi:hypothetical protein